MGQKPHEWGGWGCGCPLGVGFKWSSWPGCPCVHRGWWELAVPPRPPALRKADSCISEVFIPRRLVFSRVPSRSLWRGPFSPPETSLWGQVLAGWLGDKGSSRFYFKSNLGLAVRPEPILAMKSSVGAAEPGAQVPSGPQPPLGRSPPGQDAGWGHRPTRVCDRLWVRVPGEGRGEGEPCHPLPSSLQPSCVSAV